MRTLLIAAACLCVVTLSRGFAQDAQSASNAATAAAVQVNNDSYDFLSVNRILMWLANNGASSHNPITNGSGLHWPGESGVGIVFQDGLIWGGTVEGLIYIGGSTYRQGLQAGNIAPDGWPADPNDPRHRIYHLRNMGRAAFSRLDSAQQARMRSDFMEWPDSIGAPFVDVDANGLYEPDFDAWLDDEDASDHPFFAGEEIMWFVSNDLDYSRTTRLYGSAPLGVELHTFAWAGTQGPLLDNTVFVQYTMINKGVEQIDDLRIARWSDPDLGAAFNDFVGIDTTLNIQYVYNEGATDIAFTNQYPAFGYVWLQTPVTPSPGAEADFGFGTRADHANVPLAAHNFYINSNPIYQDPDLGVPEGAIQMHHNLQGLLYDGQAYMDPVTSTTTTATLAGDPVLGSGWIDGMVHSAHDRRNMSACAPATLAVGDTQKVLLALTIADAGNHLLSVRELRVHARQLHSCYHETRAAGVPPQVSFTNRYPDAATWAVDVVGGPFESGPVYAVMKDASGSVLTTVQLADDGLHGDGAENDGVYGGTLQGARSAVYGTLYVENGDAPDAASWFVDTDIPLSGVAQLAVNAVVSDHLNYDGKANPGENVRLQLRFENRTITDIDRWHLFPMYEAVPLIEEAFERVPINVAAGGDGIVPYVQSNRESFITVNIPSTQQTGTHLELPVAIMAEGLGIWYDTLRIMVEAPGEPPRIGRLEHVEGRASGTLDYMIADPAALTKSLYRVHVDGYDHESKSLRVENETQSRLLETGMPIPDVFGHDMPVHEGWKVLLGSAIDSLLYEENGDPLGYGLLPEYYWSAPERAWFEGYADYIIYAEDFFGSNQRVYDLVPVRLVFDRTNGQKAYRWLRGGSPSYGYVGYDEIDVRAYDISDSTAPRQITLGFVENAGGANQDGKWDPVSAGDREFFFVFADDYHDEARSLFQEAIIAQAPVLRGLYAIWPQRVEPVVDFEDGDTFTLIPRIPISKRDEYILDMYVVGVQSAPPVTTHYALHASYPNPCGTAFGSPSTIVSFDTPEAGTVRLTLHDRLGRRVRTLANEQLPAGRHSLRVQVGDLPTGLYFLSLHAGATRLTRTMHVLR